MVDMIFRGSEHTAWGFGIGAGVLALVFLVLMYQKGLGCQKGNLVWMTVAAGGGVSLGFGAINLVACISNEFTTATVATGDHFQGSLPIAIACSAVGFLVVLTFSIRMCTKSKCCNTERQI